MPKIQVARNMKIEGGFLSLLAGLASGAIPLIAKTVLPALGFGALSSLASTGVQKLVGDTLDAIYSMQTSLTDQNGKLLNLRGENVSIRFHVREI